MPGAPSLADQWRAAAAAGRPFALAGGWGSAQGTVVQPRGRGGVFPRGAAAAAGPVALLAPRWPGLEDEAQADAVDDALAGGLLRGGIRVARLHAVDFAPGASVASWIDAIVDALEPACAGASAVGLAGSWLAGTACAVASARRGDLGFLVCAGAPSAEVMSRRTPEDEDDPKWTSSASLRLADSLSELAPLEAVTSGGRPALFVQGSVDDGLAAAHLEAWRASLAASGRACDAVEVAFADRFFRTIDADGRPLPGNDAGLRLLADTVAVWASGAVTRAAARRAP